jgi:hypothetical protein
LGFSATGLSVPLGNYHNATARGRPGPEMIALRDVENARRLCAQLIRTFEPGEWRKAMEKRMRGLWKQSRRNLNVDNLRKFARTSGHWPF